MTIAEKGFESLLAFSILAVAALASDITSFKFSYENLGWEGDGYWEGNIDNDTKTITFTTQKWIENMHRLAAIFELDQNIDANVGSEQQFSGITRNDFRKEIVYTIGKNQYTVKFVSPQATGLPVIRIDTDNAAAILNRNDWVAMTFAMSDPNDPKNDISAISNQQIRGRGNSTWYLPKKPYRIRFRNHQQQSPFGLSAARNWVLLANYYDVSLFKNSLAFELGKRLYLQYTGSYNHVEFYLNKVYQGNYLFTEHKQADPDFERKGSPGRVGIDLEEGWLVEIDRRYDEEPRFRTTEYNLPIMIKSPEFEPARMSNPAYNFVKNDWNYLTNLMMAASFPESGYRDLIDIDSFVKYFLVNRVTVNHDFNILGSIFFHKDKNRKIGAGPLWDFDFSLGYNAGSVPRYEIVIGNNIPSGYPSYPFFNRFFQDPVFLARHKEIWNDNFNSISSMLQFIDGMADKIRKSANENYKIWWLNYPVDYDYWIGELRRYYELRISHLNRIYNEIDILPATKDFGTVIYDNYSEIHPQTFTLVAYGNITDLSATLQKNGLSAFEINSNWTKTQTGNGGYIATIAVKPKEWLLQGTHTDVLVLRGVNQENPFTLNVPLTFAVASKENPSDIRPQQIASGSFHAYAKNRTIVLENVPNGVMVEVYNLKGKRVNSANSENSKILKILVAKGMYVVKVGNQTLKVSVM